jgi:alpha-L-fucosidase
MERRHSEEIQPYPWQTDTCIGHWHYERNIQYRSPAEVIPELIDVVSKNGNLLLNIPMRGDGTIDESEEQFLDGLTRWMAVNGEAIYDTRPWHRYGEGTNHVPQGYVAKPVTFTAQDFRFTCKGNSLYAFCLAWPDGEVVIRSLAKGTLIAENQIIDVGLLGVEGSLSWHEEEDGLHILTPNEKPCEHIVTFKVTLRMKTGS